MYLRLLVECCHLAIFLVCYVEVKTGKKLSMSAYFWADKLAREIKLPDFT
jgi:hypothetical protein